MSLFSLPMQQHLEDTANVRNVHRLESNNGCPTNISKCIGVCPVIFRNSEIVISVRCGHRMCSGCARPECREERVIIDIHNRKKKTRRRKNISIGCYCAVKESKLITPTPDLVQG
jgi:hypothetical protein